MESLEVELIRLKDRVKHLEDSLDRMNYLMGLMNSRLKKLESTAEITVPIEKTRSKAVVVLNKNATDISSLPIVQAYNALANKSGYDSVKAYNDFRSRNNIVAFSCVNFEARMNFPIPPPNFRTVESVSAGDCWAIPMNRGNYYAVFPNISTYTDNIHDVRGIGEVFDSNFETGNVYTKIIVIKPAMFSCNGDVWTLICKGQLELR